MKREKTVPKSYWLLWFRFYHTTLTVLVMAQRSVTRTIRVWIRLMTNFSLEFSA